MIAVDELQAGDVVLPAGRYGVVREALPLKAHIRVVFTTGRVRSWFRGEEVQAERAGESSGCPRLAACPRTSCGPRTCICDPCSCPICQHRAEVGAHRSSNHGYCIDCGARTEQPRGPKTPAIIVHAPGCPHAPAAASTGERSHGA